MKARARPAHKKPQQKKGKSRHKKGKEPSENYPTPYPLAKAICERIPTLTDLGTYDFLEPSCGSGNFVLALRETIGPQPYIAAVDPHPQYKDQVLKAGASEFFAKPFEEFIAMAGSKPVIMVGNPPFSMAQRHIELAFELLPADSWVVFLLRLGFMSGLERTKTFWDYRGLPYLERVIPITPRPSFVKGTHDNSEYGVFCWRKGALGSCKIDHAIIWEKS